jgi:hypothetical protein
MSDIKLIQLSNYIKPKLEENKSKRWVMNGRDNCFYQYIIDRNNGSVTNSAINKSYTNMIYGKGLSAKDAHLKIEQWANLLSIIKPNELKKIISDFQLFGEASMQVIKTKDRKKIYGIYHLPNNTVIPSIENEEGEIESYFYCKDWKQYDKLGYEEYPSFGTSKDEIEIYVIKPYMAGCNYFANPDYLAGLPYAEMEEEISNFFINSIKKGLSAGYIINVPDGQTLTPEEKDEFERQIKAKLTGSPNALSFVLNFASKDAEITIIPFPVNEQQHKQWDFLTQESKEKIMGSHMVVSPILFGIKDNTGFGNNADELQVSREQLIQYTIAPKQDYIIDALKEILLVNDITLDLFFKPLNEVKTVQNTQLSSHVCCSNEKKNLDYTVADDLINLGESELGNEWELIDTKIIENYDTDIYFASTGVANPNTKSSQDGVKFKSRYRYIGEIKDNTREFCRKMINANKLYRLEDINLMSSKVVNEGWGANGANTYDILLYKGGGACRHVWQRETYRLNADVNSPNAEKITPSQARKEGEILPTVDNKAYQKPNDMPNNGFLKKK